MTNSSENGLDKPPNTILLLGSFDPQTKNQLENLKEEIAKAFSGENVYALMLNTVEVYIADNMEVLTELFGEDRITIFTFQNNQLTDANDIKLEKTEMDKTVYDYLKKKYKITHLSRLPIFNKLDVLMRDAKVIFLIRHKEETRGGEYLELMHALFRGHADKIWFLKKNEIALSAMLMEYLDKYEVKMRTYRGESDLENAVIRTLQYQLRNSATDN
jgi:hypothetical protein